MSTVVVLPAPLGPSSATVSPGVMEMFTSRTACTGPWGVLKVLCNPCSSMPPAGRASVIVMAHRVPQWAGRRE